MQHENILTHIKNIHLIGIGGVGMSALAMLLKEKGYRVSGSDIREGYYFKKAESCGINVLTGHRAAHIEGADIVCYSSAIRPDNPEIVAARAKGIGVYRRAEILGMISQGERVVAVCGSHGKTTTSALLVFLATSLKYKPTAFIGAQPLNYEKMAWWGNDFFIIEADESDGSFHSYSPWVSILTNIDNEHLDFYGTREKLDENFLEFARHTQELTIGWGDDEAVSGILRQVPSLSYGKDPGNPVRAEGIHYRGGYTYFDLYIKGRCYPQVCLPLLGEHNVLNTLAVISFFEFIGADIKELIRVLPEFKSTKRRFQLKSCAEGVIFIDDYAHHPTEIKATLAAARALGSRRLVVLFQPHRYSRLMRLLNEFALCFGAADCLIFTDVYAAGEEKPYDFDELALGRRLQEGFNGELHYVAKEKLAGEVSGFIKEGDVVISVGAGDISKITDEVISEFTRTRIKA
ncbi:MAG: UDP-N-acetylmuramate--L-alanine ligase [Candidatus Omnitrophica bacterium]|nr:UDP-N-acetylmuramate--L-alanine ligase [Candidatus Omnitrophota bacterium]